MNRHQVLTGSCNFGEKCHAVGSVEGIHFTVYAAGCDIVILASDFQRVQIVPGVTHGNIKVSCIDASTDSGKIVASYQQKICVFEPAPLLHHDSTHKLDYHWYQTAVFEAECVVHCLAWNLEGTKLLTGGDVVQLWVMSHEAHEEDSGNRKSVKFSLGHSDIGGGGGHEEIIQQPEHEVQTVWETIWRCKPATSVNQLQFSPDGLLFASAGKADRLVKIWYEDRKIHLPLSHADSVVSPKKESLHFSFVYLAHPRAVTGFSWRKTSKYMPRGSVANMLITWCKDNVCRIWSETILPDDGLVDLEQFDPNASFDPKFQTHRHKKRFMQRLKTISDVVTPQREAVRHAIHKRRKHSKFSPETVMSMPNMSNLTSVHDFHKFFIHQNGVVPAVHFHLAASVNPETDIPLLPVVNNKDGVEHNFQIHWLNNKELQFTMESEKVLQEMHKLGIYDDHDHDHRFTSPYDSDSDQFAEEPDENGHWQRKKKPHSVFKSNKRKSHLGNDLTGFHSDSNSSITSDHSDPMSSPEVHDSLLDTIDRKIETLLKDWHQNADMLFSVHPVDGSFLVWHVDWLDEYTPYSFRQAQISFSSRLPHAFPIPDARSMADILLMYCNYSKMDIKSAMKMCESDYKLETRARQSAAASGKSSPGQNDNMLIPNVIMISKHSNGSLNQWQISFLEESKFRTVVSVAHASRACGHRFRTNSATCHPVLPLLITTSQHNVQKNVGMDSLNTDNMNADEDENDVSKSGFVYCSELILWRVDPVGPLSKSGGIVELAKINSTKLSAFCDVAWVPTLLPSTILGQYSNSPSTLFVASDGECLRLYQAVIDARSLLMEMNTRKESMSFCSTSSSGYSNEAQDPPSELFNIVSVQSSARPGCIIELDAFTETQQMWQQTQLLHVFQEQLVTGKSSNKGDNNIDPIVDLRNLGSFEENFFLVVLEKNADGGSNLHMWKITISSQSGATASDNLNDKQYMMDYTLVDEDASNPPSRSGTPELPSAKTTTMAKLLFSTTKVLSQTLSLPEGVEVKSATVSAGHLSSASIYPACLAPYLLVTACSDGSIRFWKCKLSSLDCNLFNVIGRPDPMFMTKSFEFGVEEEDGVRRQRRKSSVFNTLQDTRYSWTEAAPMYLEDQSSSIHIPGKPMTVSCAYTGRVAIAYRSGANRPHGSTGRYFNLCVAIYECESTGGAEWVKEDTIELKNISIPENHVEVDLDLDISPDQSVHSDSESTQTLTPASTFINMCRTKSVPSLSALYSARKEQEDHEDKVGIMRPKHLVQLDWVSTEDGSHVLTVGVGSKIMMYAQVSKDIVQESQKETAEDKSKSSAITTSMNDPGVKMSLGDRSGRRAMLQKSKSMVVEDYQEVLQWMKLRCINLTTADGLPPLPMHLSWVRGGILVVGMDNEMHVYSQWRWAQESNELMSIDNDVRNFEDVNFSTIDIHRDTMLQSKKSLPNIKSSLSVPNFKRFASNVFKKDISSKSSANLKRNATKHSLQRSESSVSLTVIHELGLFEAARQSNPVLPQYHPKSLMELLNFGKVRRVKAILAHLVRCIAGREATRVTNVDDMNLDDSRMFRARTLSVTQSPGEAPVLNEESPLDYVEITSIPLLPLYALLAADNDLGPVQADISAHSGPISPGDKLDYKDLFQSNVLDEEELNTDVFSTSADSKPKLNRSLSQSAVTTNPNHFGITQAQLLGKHLTHMHLPNLSGQDQMYLLALADTVAQTKSDFADSFEPTAGQTGGTGAGSHTAESLDDCGLRFLLSMRHYTYLMRSLPPVQRVQLVKQGLKTFNIVWAFHSEATEELLSLIPSAKIGELTWMELKTYGAGWWINNINVLKRTVEKMAKSAFQAKKDPMDACLFYLALKKKNVLWGLFRSIENKRMADFFKNDFTQDRWRKAALKNAFDLLGKQRFDHAAGFFLLAGSLSDAIEVVLDKLHDMQLALVMCRLFEGDDMMCPSVKKILYVHMLGCDADGTNYNADKMHPDPFLRSMTYWLFKDYRNALQTLLQTDLVRHIHRNQDPDTFAISNVFNFYNYLRTHPLLIRHRIASAVPSLKNKRVITGFTKQQTIVGTPEDEVATFVDRVTPMERRLFFETAHAHYKNGCPVLALEVLSKLPVVTSGDDDLDTESHVSKSDSDACINTGNISDFTNGVENTGNVQNSKTNNSTVVDWGQPISFKQTADAFDWGPPVSNSNQTADSFDWGQPTSRFDGEDELKLDFSSSDDEESNSSDKRVENGDINGEHSGDIPSIVVADVDTFHGETPSTLKDRSEKKSKVPDVDIFAQQYKFIACLKVMMEEMQTLATGFEVDGGQLRYQVYIWLEREVDALRWLCGYLGDDDLGEDERTVVSDGPFDDDEVRADSPLTLQHRGFSRSDASKPTLHETILAEKMDLDAKMERMGHRKQWLRQNQQLLRTLIAYCVLQGAGGGGIASVQMELLLLLQELQQEKPQQQLLSPLPFPTTLPLLSASIASSKTVTADPIQHIQCLCQDLLHSVIEFTTPPSLGGPLHTVLVMRNLSIALASCVYQCLCDSDSFVVALNENNMDVGFEGFYNSNNFFRDASHLMAGVRKTRTRSGNSATSDDIINTPPGKWPGVTSLRVLLAREKDEDSPKLNILLTESLVAVYVSLLINSLATFDCFMLYRLTAHKFDQQLWSSLFGGGVKSIVRLGNPSHELGRKDDMYNKRVRLNMKIMGQGRSESKKTYKEKFVPPELSMITYFMTKPFVENSDTVFSYDSDDSMSSEEEEEVSDEDDDDLRPKLLSLANVHQHTDPNSYAWCLLRYAIVKLVLHNLSTFLPHIGIELQELPVCSPLLHAVLRIIEQWEEVLLGKLELFAAPPDNFIPGLEFQVVPGMPSTKYKALMDKSNSPFIESHATLPIKRLWFHLIKQDKLRDVFVRYVFRKQKIDPLDREDSSLDGVESPKVPEPFKIIHKEQDIITAFAINQANASCLTLATQKELIELDIHHLLNPPVWLDDENEMDIESFNNPGPGNPAENVDFLVVQTPSDMSLNYGGSGSNTPLTNQSSAASTPTVNLAPGQQALAQTGRGTNVLAGTKSNESYCHDPVLDLDTQGKGFHIHGVSNPFHSYLIVDRSRRLVKTVSRRPMAGVRRISSHPMLPHYLTGNTDGSVRLWEWGHSQPLAMLRAPGTFPKVTKVLFNSHGNKCCVSDTEGQICLWQVGHGSNFNKPIMSLSCHNKTTSDFVFVGSSSLIATAGHSSESRNVCLWDTLLPPRSACVHAFTCHEHGSPALVFAPHHQLLISGGRKGEICIFDIRQRQMRHTFQAHESLIRCLAIDPEEEYFVTGSADGDVKVWSLGVHQLVVGFPGEHTRSNTFFRSVGSATGVTQVAIGPKHHLFSCGVDGSMKFRALPERESIVRYWNNN